LSDRTKTGRRVNSNATQLAVCEAKMFSRLSAGTTRAREYDQAARTVGCIAWALRQANRTPGHVQSLAFCVIASQPQLDAGVFGALMTWRSIVPNIRRRLADYASAGDTAMAAWYDEWVQPLEQTFALHLLAWEDLLSAVRQQDPGYGSRLDEFYQKCLHYNAAGL
jgi:hypothetical protein